MVAPFGQKVVWMATGKDASRIGAESRWREGIFLGLFGAGQGANDYAVGTPDGVEVWHGRSWDVELLLSVQGLPWDRNRRDPTVRVSMPRTPLPAGVLLATEPRAGGRWRARSSRPGTVYIRKNVEIPKYGAISTKNRSLSHNSECRKRVESATRDDAVGAERLEESPGDTAPGPDVVMGRSARTSRRTRRTARPVQSMRLAELSCETVEAADVFCPGRLAASWSF